MFHLVARCHLDIGQVSIMIYPGLQMVCVDDRLFQVHIEWDKGRDAWAQYLKLLQEEEDGDVPKTDTTCQIFTAAGKRPFITSPGLVGSYSGFYVPINEKIGEDRWTCNNNNNIAGVRIIIMTYLNRIQRMVKRRQAHARRVRLLAVLMCFHDRLGQDSLLGRLPVDILLPLLLLIT